MDKNTFYITTPIYYPSGNWHIGHCYTTVVCDAFARFNRMLGKDVFFLTGTDEHGQKIEKKAQEKGLTPMEFINPLVAELKEIWSLLNVSYDKFIRTTDDYHVKSVQKIFEKLYERGEIYKSEYEGWYCSPCESFWTESQLVDGKCPDCGREVQKEKEESYFFKLGKYADKIVKLYEDNPEFLQPKSRVNEMVNNFIKSEQGLQDLCVSRTTIKWGVPVTFDKKHTVYVWIDALSNYITALGYGSEDDSLYKKYWPVDLHMTGKEIIRFHAIIWPAILMALGEEVPKQVYGHGWLLIGGDKLSKSKQDKVGNELTDPLKLVQRYGSDAVRYFLLREIPFGNDGVYTNESLLTRINSDLANIYGNLVARTTAMIGKYFGGVLPQGALSCELDKELSDMAISLTDKVKEKMSQINVPEALNEIFKVLSRANKYIDETEPWKLAKDETQEARLGEVLYNLSEVIRICSIMLKPFITEMPTKALAMFGITEQIKDFSDATKWGVLQAGITVTTGILFPRIDMQAEIKKMNEIAEEKIKKEVKVEEVKETKEITIDEFFKTQLKVAEVIACEKVAKSEKLLKSTLKVGEETRTVVSGIAKYYTPEQMVGKKVILVANLKPCKLCGVVSEGMLLCAEDGDKVCLLTPEEDMPSGSIVG